MNKNVKHEVQDTAKHVNSSHKKRHLLTICTVYNCSEANWSWFQSCGGQCRSLSGWVV